MQECVFVLSGISKKKGTQIVTAFEKKIRREESSIMNYFWNQYEPLSPGESNQLSSESIQILREIILSNDHGSQTRARKPRRKKVCNVLHCNRPVQLANRCYRHGGHQICEVPGCKHRVRSNKKCLRHGGGNRCTFVSHTGPCVRRGNKEGLCSVHREQLRRQT